MSYDWAVQRVEVVPADNWEEWVTDNDAVILDVRQPSEWKLGTLPGALLIPMSDLISRVEEIPRDRPVLCVCRSGSRSERVASYLSISGFTRPVNMGGGMKALGMQD